MSRDRRSNYEKFIQDGFVRLTGTDQEIFAQRDALWQEDLLRGTESPEEAAYRLRYLETSRQNWAGITCDRIDCEEKGAKPLSFIGSAGVIFDTAAEAGWEVPKPWGLNRERRGTSSRLFVFCADHFPGDDHSPGEFEVWVEQGYEEAFESLPRG